MIHWECDQNSHEWEELRKGRFTASEFHLALGTEAPVMVALTSAVPDDDTFGRAHKQREAFEKLSDAPGRTLPANLFGDAIVKGLTNKGLAAKWQDHNGCTIRVEAAKRLIDKLIARRMFTDAELGEFLPTDAMERGSILEAQGRREFAFLSGIKVDECGFILHPDLPMCGASPDGLCQDGGVLEVKCPLPQNHLTYLRKKGEMPKQYRPQVHGQMAITGANHAWFVSFCPGADLDDPDGGLRTLIHKEERSLYTENLFKCLQQFEQLYQEQLDECKIANLKDL